MEISQSYRLNKAILCVNSAVGGRRTFAMIPAGDTVTITEGPFNELRMVDVLWGARSVMLFAVDLRERATLIMKRAANEEQGPVGFIARESDWSDCANFSQRWLRP
jgi:hypothetical protein